MLQSPDNYHYELVLLLRELVLASNIVPPQQVIADKLHSISDVIILPCLFAFTYNQIKYLHMSRMCETRAF